jgi:hypothetical protein
MSKKPAKKSDADKGWMKKRRDNRRMIAPEYHMIAPVLRNVKIRAAV